MRDPAYANYPGSLHPGTDFGLPANTPLVAGMSGTVTIYDRNPNIHVGRGKEVQILNGNKQRRTCHMNRIDVSDGQVVTEGQPIGVSGYTGYVVDVVDGREQVGTPGGAHLHDELLINGQYVNLEDNLNQEDDMPNEGDAENFIRIERGDPNYQPTQAEIDAAMKKSLRDWAYQFADGWPPLNDGDIDNGYGATDGRKATKEEKNLYRSKPFKKLYYEQILPKTTKLRESQNTKYEPYKGAKLFNEVV